MQGGDPAPQDGSAREEDDTRAAFRALIRDMGTAAGIEDLEIDADGTCVLEGADREALTILHREDIDFLSVVVTLPLAVDEGAPRLLHALLRANMGFWHRMGVTVGLEEDGRLAVISGSPRRDFTGDSLASFVDGLLDVGAEIGRAVADGSILSDRGTDGDGGPTVGGVVHV